MIKKLLNFALNVSMIIIIIILIYSMIQKRVSKENYTNIFGYTFLEVLTGSMADTIEIGDGVIVKLTNDIKEQDIIVYKKDNILVTHRLIEKDEGQLIAKGDANNVQDEPITGDMAIGKVIYVISNIHMWKKVIGIVFVVFIVLFIMVKIILYKKQKPERGK